MKMVRVSLLAICVMLFASAAFADDKADLYRKGTEAVNAGDAISAADAFCALTKVDPAYQDAAAQCAIYKSVAEKVLNRYKTNYAYGLTALEARDYATAEKEFEKVKGGQLAEQAKQRLAEIALAETPRPGRRQSQSRPAFAYRRFRNDL
jgi:outer membrane protein assembly factor BamD (BamD/ComL family)